MTRTLVFRGKTLDEALAGARVALGPGAVILETRRRRKYRLFGPVQAEIVARAGVAAKCTANPGDVAPSRTAAAERPAGGTIQAALQELLVTAGVAPGLATMLSVNSLMGQSGHLVSARELSGRLGDALAEMVGTVRPADVGKGGSRVIAFIGPHGGGKTTALAKLACELVLGGNTRVGLLTADTQRIGAVDQVARYADILGSYFGTAYTPGELRRLRDEAAVRADTVLVDTPGCNWRSSEDLGILSSLLEAAQPDEVHLVVPAVYQLSVAEHLMAAFRPLGVDRLLITKLDEAETYGPVINFVAGGRLPLSYAGLGPEVPGTLWVPDPGHLARMLLAGKSPQEPVEARAENGEVYTGGHGPA